MYKIKELSRYEILHSQFNCDDIYIHLKIEQSLQRIFDFLYDHTNIHYLSFIRAETLMEYLKYHKSNQFNAISFVQAIYDIKVFLWFLNRKPEIKTKLTLDLSINNLDIWTKL